MNVNSQPLISVIVPVYNRTEKLKRAVGSICAQSYPNLDIIVADDCSTEDIAGAMASLNDPRIRVVRRAQNGGAAAARNTGLDAVKADFIAFHDSDDVSLFDRFEREMRVLQDNPDLIGVYTASVAHTDTSEAERPRAAARTLPPVDRSPLSGDLFRATLRGNFIDMPTMLLRRDAVMAAGRFDERLRNNVDWDFTLRLTQQGKFGFIPQPLYLFSYKPRSADGNDHISHDTRLSRQSYVYITGKLRRAGHSTQDLAKHYGNAAAFLILANRPRLARRYLVTLLKARATPKRAALLMAFSYMPGLYAKVRSWRGF